MFAFDIEQPNVLYSAEESGYVHRIDLRFNNSKELLFENRSVFYRNSPIFDDDSMAKAVLPKWSGLGAVMSVLQAPSISSPHLIIGGKGMFVGMLDLRITNRPSLMEENLNSSAPTSTLPTSISSSSLSSAASNSTTSSRGPALLSSFTKMWSPLFQPSCDSPKKAALISKYSSLSRYHPFSSFDTATVDSSQQHHSSSFHHPGISPRFEDVAISGLGISKSGKRLVASYRNDQIYTFKLFPSTSCQRDYYGIEDVIGGHINYATFLKTVSFFGPNDEYIVSGSDSGHLWMWESSTTYEEEEEEEESRRERKRMEEDQREEEEEVSNSVNEGRKVGRNGEEHSEREEDRSVRSIDQQSITAFSGCKIVTVLKADLRTCNGVIPHPIAPILVSYGIDSDAKLWSFQSPSSSSSSVDDESSAKVGGGMVSSPSINFPIPPSSSSSSSSSSASSVSSLSSATSMQQPSMSGTTVVTNAAVKYYHLCKHDGLRDNEKYSRISIPLPLYNTSLSSIPTTTNPFAALSLLSSAIPFTSSSLFSSSSSSSSGHHFTSNSMVSLPYILEINKMKANSLYSDRLHNEKSRSIPQVISPFTFNDTIYNLRKNFFQENLDLLLKKDQQKKEEEKDGNNYEILRKDIGHFMPSDTLFEILDLNRYDSS
jgi:hypothetical protein